MERSLPDPRHAFKNELALMKRQIRQTRSRQGWPGKVQQTPLSTLVGATRTGFSDTGYSTAAILRLDPGAWTLIARATLSVDAGGEGAANYTGQEKAIARLMTTAGEQIDYVEAQPSATPEPAYTGGFLNLPVMLFGLVTLAESMEVRLEVQVVDAETAATVCRWVHKMMATPV